MPPVAARTYKDFLVRRIIIEKDIDRKIGFESDDPPEGWRWDYRYLVGDKQSETLPFPGLRKNHLGSLPRAYWQNGPVSGRSGTSTKVEEIKEMFARGRSRWVPVIHRGDVSIWRDSTYLFSDDSVVETVSPDSLSDSGRSVHLLQRELRPGSPILATIYKRASDGEFLPWRNYIPRERFTGLLDLDGVSHLSTRTGDTILWDNIDTTRREFIPFVVDEGVRLIFNKVVTETITSLDTPTVVSDFNDKEYLGSSDGTDDQVFGSQFWPIAEDDSLSVYVVNVSTGLWDEYTVVESFTGANQVIVDYDLGRFTFGTTAEGSTPPPASGRAIYIEYKAVPRVEYEEDGYGDTQLAIDADVNPLGQSINKGFVVLSRSELDVARITLETTKPAYRGLLDTFGPVYVGADYANLIATVYSSSGDRVPNVEVTFWILTSPPFGGLGGSHYSVERRTDYLGEARTYFVPPNDINSMGFYATSITDSNTITISDEAHFGETSDVWTYHVLKDDPWKGKVGADTSLGEIEWSASPPNGRKVIWYGWNSNAINPITGHLGAYAPIRPTSITDGNVITYTDTLSTPDPTTSDTNLGAYWLISDRYVEIQATAYSPSAGRTIRSNILKLRVEIPLYMKGEYVKESLQEIPFGWRIKDETYEVASAVGGATYISINPVAGPYPIVDVIEGETWDPYSGPESDPYVFWPYEGYPVDGVSRPFAHLGFFGTVV